MILLLQLVLGVPAYCSACEGLIIQGLPSIRLFFKLFKSNRLNWRRRVRPRLPTTTRKQHHSECSGNNIYGRDVHGIRIRLCLLNGFLVNVCLGGICFWGRESMIPVDGRTLQTRHLPVGPAHLDGIHLISGPQSKVQLVGMLRAVGISCDNLASVFSAPKFHRYARPHW